jgi:hypothetical protein
MMAAGSQTMNWLPATLALAALAGCESCDRPVRQVERVPAVDEAACRERMEEIVALRDGPQPCKDGDECAVWHNDEY